MSQATNDGAWSFEAVRRTSPVVVIGARREELGFGERVAEGLGPGIAVLRIPQGISGHRPRPDEVFYYETRHRELYLLQLRQQVRGRYKLVIDLHRGVNQPGRCADVYCRDPGLLRCGQRAALHRYGRRNGTRLVRRAAGLPLTKILRRPSSTGYSTSSSWALCISSEPAGRW